MELTAKLGTKSPVWQYFGLAADDDGKVKSEDQAVCRLCQRIVMAKGSNTSNLQSHLKNHHPLKFAEIKQVKSVENPTMSHSCGQVTIDEALSKGEKVSPKLETVARAVDRFGNPLLGEGHDAYLFRRQTGLLSNAGAV